MTILRSSAATLLALSLGSATIASPAENCVSEAEAVAVFAAMMPDMIDGLRGKCAAHLPANAYLVASGDALIARYKVLADQRWPAAKIAFGRIAGDEEMTSKMPDQYLRPLIGSVVGSELIKDFKVEDCPGADRIVESLAPLPPENVAVLVGTIVVLADGKKGQKDSFPICKA
ncbi:hypothetical protein LVY65_03850 [Sphingomonas sp. G124]|uniref:Secreted protein n=1 Tax=Sphingomonas cremea TaxID=2904799 RepID=A0A9X1QLN5_9SPHN|nr:hypothetical protein [Sphingomonas cremea]MCF2514203.1 hypothetical protein [Sphingomonas cremea]